MTVNFLRVFLPSEYALFYGLYRMVSIPMAPTVSTVRRGHTAPTRPWGALCAVMVSTSPAPLRLPVSSAPAVSPVRIKQPRL